MVEFSTVKESEAPKGTTATLSKAQREAQESYNTYVRSIAVGEVGKLVLGEHDIMRAVKTRVRRASKRMGVEIGKMWSVGNEIYFSVKAA